jgi:hypothetical protein
MFVIRLDGENTMFGRPSKHSEEVDIDQSVLLLDAAEQNEILAIKSIFRA